MKAFVMVCLTAILASAIGAPAPALSAEDAAWQKVVEAAKREGVVNHFTFNFSGSAGIQVSKAFRDKYGITVELTAGESGPQREKIRMEQKSKSYVMDAFESSGAMIGSLKNENYFESVAEALPVLKEKDKFSGLPIEDPPEAQILSFLLGFNGLWVNTDLVKPDQEPKSFFDLLDPKWKGKIYLTNPLYVSGPDATMELFVKEYKVLDEAYFIKLYKNATLGGTGGPGEAVDRLVRGEFAIVGFIPGASAMKPFLAGAPIKPLDLKEGNMFRAARWGALKNRPHPNATRVFINWLLSKDGQLVATKALRIDGVRNDIPSASPFHFTGRPLKESYETMLRGEDRRSKNYLANLLGIKK